MPIITTGGLTVSAGGATVTGALTVTGANNVKVTARQGIDTAAAGTLVVGGTTATALTLGSATAPAAVLGALTVTGDITAAANFIGLRDKGGQVYNVKAYGAKGDGMSLAAVGD